MTNARNHAGLRPTSIFVFLATAAVLALIISVGAWLLLTSPFDSATDRHDVSGLGGGGYVPARLAALRDEIPKPAYTVTDEDSIYTGGPTLGSIYWSKLAVPEVITFFETQLSKRGWEVSSRSPLHLRPADEKSSGGSDMTVTFVKGPATVTVSAAQNVDKDPARGTTRIGIEVEDPSALN